jgi:hypothetical protein
MSPRIFVTIALLAAGCGGEVQPAENASAIHVAALPPVAGCDSVAKLSTLALRLHPVAEVTDLFLVEAGDQALCIDSGAGVQEMVFRLHTARELASSNPMPGDNGDTSSNPMPGDPGSSTNTGSNPMPGTDHKH